MDAAERRVCAARYVDDAENDKSGILDAKSLTVIETIEGLSGHGMNVSPSGDDIYVIAPPAGIRRYSRKG